MFRVGKVLSFLAGLASWISTAIIVLMMLHVTADVVGRYVFNTPLPGTIVVVAHYYMIIMVFIALGAAEEKNAHISVEFLTDLMPKTVQGWLTLFAGLVSVVVFGLLAYGGYLEAYKKTRSGASMEQGSEMIAIWPSYWAIPFGAGLIALIAVYKVVVIVTKSRSGLNETMEDAELINE